MPAAYRRTSHSAAVGKPISISPPPTTTPPSRQLIQAAVETPSPPSDDLVIPTIDLASGLSEAELAVQLRQACTTVGFFHLTGHGVNQDVMAAAIQHGRDFFHLPTADKLTCYNTHGPSNRGYRPLGLETLSMGKSKPDTKEAFYVARDISADSAERDLPYFNLSGPNVWPTPGLGGLPLDWQETMETYHAQVWDLANRLLPIFALALGLPRDHFLQPGMFDMPFATMKLNRYTTERSIPDAGVLACGAHSDFGMFTLLTTDGVPGLQLLKEGTWVDVPPQEGDFIVNIGDALEMWSNDTFKSTIHRVVNKTATERVSLPFFFGPNLNCLVEPFPELCVNGGPKHAPFYYGQYIIDRYAEAYKDFKKPTH